MADKGKSVLDDREVAEKGFPLGEYVSPPAWKLHIVGHCNICGNPVYGNHTFEPGAVGPTVYRSCACVYQAKTIQDAMQVK